MTKKSKPARRSLIPCRGTLLVWGEDRAPELHLPDERTAAMLFARMASDNPHRRASAVPLIFGAGFTEIVPADREDTLRGLGENYKGCRQAEVRRICAALVLGIPFQELNARGPGGDGGERVLSKQPPVKPAPGGIAVGVLS